MKYVILFIALSSLWLQNAYSWGNAGHRDIIAVAQRHLTPQAQSIISNLLHHDLKEEADWMDKHRTGEWAFTSQWHVLYFDKNLSYDPDPTLSVNPHTKAVEDRGDALKTINRAVYTLSDYKHLTDSAFLFNLRCLVHMIGDMHCPVHCLIPGRTKNYASILDEREFYPVVSVLVPVKYNNKEYISYHVLFDNMPAILFPDKTPDQVAALLDNKSKKEIRQIIGQKAMAQYNGRYDCSLPLYRWARECAQASMKIWDYNPDIVYDLNPSTAELSRPMVEQELRHAGYRLAWILNTVLR